MATRSPITRASKREKVSKIRGYSLPLFGFRGLWAKDGLLSNDRTAAVGRKEELPPKSR
jgi:hypothetical protein